MKQTGWRYTVYMTDEGWLAEAHCDCGSTVTGSPKTQTSDAIASAQRALSMHLRRSLSERCGTRNHDPALRLEDEIKASLEAPIELPLAPAFLGKLDDHGGGDAPEPGTTEHASKIAAWPYMVIR